MSVNRLTRVLLIVVAVVGSLVVIYLKNPPILGLDLRGGVMLLLEADFSRNSEMTASERDAAVDDIVETIRFRVNASGLAETSVSRLGENRVSVEIPCADEESCENPEDLRNLIERRGFLEFKKVLREVNPTTETIGSNEQLIFDTDGNAYVVQPQPLMTGAAIEDAFSQFGASGPLTAGGGFEIALTFTDQGAQAFQNLLTGPNAQLPAGSVLGIILDNTMQSAPAISQDIVSTARTSGWQGLKRGSSITGDFTQEEANNLAIVLRSGNLPVPVRVLQDETVGPSMGADSIQKGLFATVLAGILVLIFMIAYYKLAGIVANLTIALNLLMLVAVMMLLDATWTLPGIAGLILTIGMGVDSNVLIFERVREELRSGKTVRASIDFGYERALLTIVDAHVTTLITALILFTF